MHIPKPSETAPADQQASLYEKHTKIIYRPVQGVFNHWRVGLVWLTQIVWFLLPWMPWGDRPAVLFDLEARKFYLFDWVFWPQEFVWLAVLLIIAALALFLFTAIAGRLWCGYACPQTVYTEIFVWIERLFEGDHKAQTKLDARPWDMDKLWRRGGKQAVWILFSLWNGFTLIAYYTPATVLWNEVITFSTGPWETFWILFYALATWGFAGMMREQVCKYMCPYARFQSAMFDEDTLIVTYDYQRGEPRGARRKDGSEGLGDCVDCGLCVAVCPTGIDIRDGLQYMCIGCGACVDACNPVMDKIGRPRGLIRYSTQNAIDGKYPDSEIVKRMSRPRILFYGAVFMGIVAAFFWSMAERIPLRVDVLRDRATLSRPAKSGGIENLYRLQLINMDDRAHRFHIRASGIEGLQITRGDTIELAPLATQDLIVVLEASRLKLNRPVQPIQFVIEAEDDASLRREAKSSFLK